MKKIALTLNKYALVDDEDYTKLIQFKWCAHRNPTGVEKYYALRKGSIRMHRFILGLNRWDKVDVDHINGNGLDNRRCNLRICTRRQNCCNRTKQKLIKGKKLSSVYLGVCFDTSRGKWISYINLNGRRKHLGRFKHEEDAAVAYNVAAIASRGQYASLNKFDKGE